MPLRQTHTYVILPLSAAAYREIRARLVEAGYSHAFHDQVARASPSLQPWGQASVRANEREFLLGVAHILLA